MEKRTTDVLVIGGGPAGYVAGIRLGQLGTSALLVERKTMGGTCLNVGCIPSKVLIAAGRKYLDARDGVSCGIMGGEHLSMNLERLQEFKSGVVAKLTGGVRQLVKAHGTEIIDGSARFSGPNTVVVSCEGDDVEVTFKKVIVCTGSVPVNLPFLPLDGERIIGSKQALELTSIPDSLCVIGGGVIGLELGQFYAMLGTKVTVVEALKQVMPEVEKDLVRPVTRAMKKLGMTLLSSSKVTGVNLDGDLVKVSVQGKKGTTELEVEKVLVTIGRKPSFAELDLHKAGLTVEGAFVKVNDRLETEVPHIYAAGDITGNPLLAHRASAQAEVAAENASGHSAFYNPLAIPAVCYTTPEVATVGLTVAQAQERGLEVRVGKMMFGAVGRALASGHDQGFIRYVADAGSDVILGVQIVGHEASELISEAVIAVEMKLTAKQLGRSIHAHPTLGEAAMEAAKAVHNQAIHMGPSKKR